MKNTRKYKTKKPSNVPLAHKKTGEWYDKTNSKTTALFFF
jgi:hypothetical protein